MHLRWGATRIRIRPWGWQARRAYTINANRARCGTLRQFTEWRCAPPGIPPFLMRRVERLYGPL